VRDEDHGFIRHHDVDVFGFGEDEVHPDPEQALSDGYQSLDFGQFEEMMELCGRVADAVGKTMEPGEACTIGGA